MTLFEIHHQCISLDFCAFPRFLCISLDFCAGHCGTNSIVSFPVCKDIFALFVSPTTWIGGEQLPINFSKKKGIVQLL